MTYKKSFEEIRQEKIDKAVKNKEKHYTKTELSILCSWAINNAVNLLSETEKDNLNWEKIQEIIKSRYPFFIELYREWMMDNMPVEYEPIFPAQSEALEEQGKEFRAEQKVKEEAIARANLELNEETESNGL